MATVRSAIADRCPNIAAMSLPAESMHCEKSATAVLRGGTSSRNPWLGLLYGGRHVQMELRSQGDVLWSGVWGLEVRRDGRLAEPVSGWEEVHWVSDERVDYVELTARFTGGIQVERQVFLTQEGFLLLADAIVARKPALLEYRAALPLAPGVRFLGADESREGVLATRGRRAMVLPLALPEWRADERVGSLGATQRGLELRQSAEGRAVFSPLFVDLVPNRFRRPFTWRQLTVAENRRVQPADVAAGFRVQVGRQQWLMYRSLAAHANRSLLGHNLSSQMLVARFGRNGKVDALLEIE